MLPTAPSCSRGPQLLSACKMRLHLPSSHLPTHPPTRTPHLVALGHIPLPPPHDTPPAQPRATCAWSTAHQPRRGASRSSMRGSGARSATTISATGGAADGQRAGLRLRACSAGSCRPVWVPPASSHLSPRRHLPLAREADVVCRQLGFRTPARAIGSAHFGAGSGRQWLDSIWCYANQARLSDCFVDYTPAWGTVGKRCSHARDVAVICEAAPGACGGASAWRLHQSGRKCVQAQQARAGPAF